MTNYIDGLCHQDDIAIAVRDYGGEGLPVVLLHGGGRNLSDWNAIAPLLTTQHRVVSMEFRSHGQSTPCDTVWSFHDAVRDLEAVSAYFDLNNPFVIGHSLGGIVATLYGAAHPDCRGVMNIDGVGVSIPHLFPGPDPQLARQNIASMISSLASAELTENLPTPPLLTQTHIEEQLAAIRKQQEQQGNDPAAGVDRVSRSYYRRPDGRYEENPSARAVQALSLAIMGIDIFRVNPQVRCPLLFLAAREQAERNVEVDPADIMRLWQAGVDLEFADLASRHTNIKWTSLPGDHMSIMQAPVPLAERLLIFMRGG